MVDGKAVDHDILDACVFVRYGTIDESDDSQNVAILLQMMTFVYPPFTSLRNTKLLVGDTQHY